MSEDEPVELVGCEVKKGKINAQKNSEAANET